MFKSFARARGLALPFAALVAVSTVVACGKDSTTTSTTTTGTTTTTTTGTTTSTGTSMTTSTSTGSSMTTGTGTSSSTGTSTSTGMGGAAPLLIDGNYTDDFGNPWIISDTLITEKDGMGMYPDSLFHIQKYDNLTGYAAGQNDAANSFNPSLYSRFVWTMSAGDLYVCQDPYDAMSLNEAETAPSPDSADLEAGCGGFKWSMLTPM